MKKVFASVLACGLASLLVHAQTATARLEGTWLLTAAIADGQTVPPQAINFTAGKMIFLNNGEYQQRQRLGANPDAIVEAGKYRFDAAKNPPTVDLQITVGDDRGKTQLGIFKLEGNKLTLALGKSGSGVRPQSFDGAKNVELTFFNRAK